MARFRKRSFGRSRRGYSNYNNRPRRRSFIPRYILGFKTITIVIVGALVYYFKTPLMGFIETIKSKFSNQ